MYATRRARRRALIRSGYHQGSIRNGSHESSSSMLPCDVLDELSAWRLLNGSVSSHKNIMSPLHCPAAFKSL